jgi:hypothetical protein
VFENSLKREILNETAAMKPEVPVPPEVPVRIRRPAPVELARRFALRPASSAIGIKTGPEHPVFKHILNRMEG